MTDHPATVGEEPVHQAAPAVLMIHPTRFSANPQTRKSNHFQSRPSGRPSAVADRARAETEALAVQLAANGVRVLLADGRADMSLPDEVFPNNWISCHADGTVLTYPMLANNRRMERRQETVDMLRRVGRLAIRRMVDLSAHERDHHFLEGTGSIVFDHIQRIAFACLSPRTHEKPLREVCALLGYRPMPFTATDRSGLPIYHTNVLMSLGTKFAVICADVIRDRAEREALLATIEAGGREVLVIGRRQMQNFAANILELRGDGPVIAMSTRAHAAWAESDQLSRFGRLVIAHVPTIETGGGSVRCMLAELSAPRFRSEPDAERYAKPGELLIRCTP